MNKKTYIAELTLIYAIPELLIGPAYGSLKTKYDRLQKECKKEMARKRATRINFIDAQKCIDKFFKLSGWIEKKKHIGTCLSFVLAMIDESENKFPKIIVDSLNGIVQYYENKEQFKVPCYSAGAFASEKWSNVKREVFNV